jgi:hypothetical protein
MRWFGDILQEKCSTPFFGSYFSPMVDEKSLFVYWGRKSRNATTVFVKMEGGVDPSAPAWVTKWLRALMRGENICEPSECSVKPEDPLTGLKVVKFHNLNLFSNVSRLVTPTQISRSTGLDDFKGWE